MGDSINLTINQFCDALGCGRSKVYELIGEGEVEAIKLGKRTLIPRTELERLQARLPRIQPRTHGPPASQISDISCALPPKQLDDSSTSEVGRNEKVPAGSSRRASRDNKLRPVARAQPTPQSPVATVSSRMVRQRNSIFQAK
jgi:excisionase family DNA binding protein